MNKIVLITTSEELAYKYKVIFNELSLNSMICLIGDEYNKFIEKINLFDPNIIVIDYDVFLKLEKMFLDILNLNKIKIIITSGVLPQSLQGRVFKTVRYSDEIDIIKKIIIESLNLVENSEKKIIDEINKRSFKGFIYYLIKKHNINLDLDKVKSFDDIFKFYNLQRYGQLIYSSLAEYLKVEYIKNINPEDIISNVFSINFMESNLIIPINIMGDRYFVVYNPFDINIHNLLNSDNFRNEYRLAISDKESIFKTIYLFKNPVNDKIDISNENNIDVLNVDKNIIDSSPVIYITNKIIENAIKMRSSDIHIEPKEKYYLIRFRIDGDLVEYNKIKIETGLMVIARIKALAKMDITDRRRPQDGSVSIRIGEKRYVLRVSTTSTNYGEELVARIIDMSSKIAPLFELGMYNEQIEIMKNLANSTQGVIIIAAPTGSGKTTTIYSFLGTLDLKKKKLMSVEDPVEFRIKDAVQQEVNEKAGVSFSNLLKASVRQDPDILFLGEIRDEESAKIAFDFSSTGHLTITTIHTSNATTAITRLERLGITRSQISDTVLCIISQRLIKKLCDLCKVEYVPSDSEKKLFELFKLSIPKKLYRAVGCSRCLNSGYYSRIAVYEIIKFDSEISNMILKGLNVKDIRLNLFKKGHLLTDSYT